jgi:hypothetical protein
MAILKMVHHDEAHSLLPLLLLVVVVVVVAGWLFAGLPA